MIFILFQENNFLFCYIYFEFEYLGYLDTVSKILDIFAGKDK